MPKFVKTEIQKDVAFLTLNRPEKRNALTREFIQEMNEFVLEVNADNSIRLLVLQAEGKVFCAGMDLTQMQSRATAADPESEWDLDSQVYQELVSNLFSLSIPTLAVLQGPVLAGGTGMVFACDMVLAAEESFISLPEPKRGIVAAMVSPLIAYRANRSVATYLLLSGKPADAQLAKQFGLYHEVVPAIELENAKYNLVNSVLTGSHSALQMTKQHLGELAKVDVIGQIRDSVNVSAVARHSADAKEGLAAFNEKRKPAWETKLN